ncbi:MAG TPA: HEAT repeat domain-containing protein, partial [Pyrinomonadaceae bacterium]|nr:HEAT repeat domain-containing protein [Pyrinomonadaceae bacterium]
MFKIIANVTAVILLLAGFGLAGASLRAQEKISPVTISSVSSHASANGTVVSIDANGPLNRAQTWQDREGYHVVVPAAGAQNAIKGGNGIKVRQLDHTLEIVIQTKPGASVTVQPLANRLNLNVEGKLDPRDSDSENQNANSDKAKGSDSDSATAALESVRSPRLNKANDVVAKDNSDATAANPEVAAPASQPPSAPPQGNSSQLETATGESSVMSDTTIYIVLGVAFIGGLLIVRRWKINQSTPFTSTDSDGFEEFGDAEERPEIKLGKKPRGSVPKPVSSPSTAISTQRKSPARMTVAMPASLYGAYQVDMEVSKLVHGQPHRMDVVGSRAPDDRRAIEASLLKSINSSSADDDIQRRARGALEEYGFVARQSASLLSAPDAYERTSAARMLGDVKAPSALPFLLEALYDSESQVRNQAVLSIGELRLPSAIGALLDIARKHPDVPGTLLCKALNACSVESFDFFDGSVPEPRLLSGVDAHLLAEEIFRLEPAVAAEELPETIEDENFSRALTQIQSEVITDRSEGIKLLGLFQVREAVSALFKVARTDAQSSLRAAAISSLASINHETVFPAILIAMADESREVRAAAARSLSRLSFDRADAYIRVTRSDDVETLRDVAEACVKAGIANQGIDRMTNGDHQAYEAMSVVDLLVKAEKFDPLFNAIENHPNMDVRMTLVHLLGMTGDAAL